MAEDESFETLDAIKSVETFGPNAPDPSQGRGVWLDRGQLDKIIDRAGAFDDSFDYAKKHSPEPQRLPKKKPKSFLKDLLGFD